MVCCRFEVISCFAPGNNYRSEAAVSLFRQPNVNGLLYFFWKSLLILLLGLEMKSLRAPMSERSATEKGSHLIGGMHRRTRPARRRNQVGNVTPERGIPATDVEEAGHSAESVA